MWNSKYLPKIVIKWYDKKAAQREDLENKNQGIKNIKKYSPADNVPIEKVCQVNRRKK